MAMSDDPQSSHVAATSSPTRNTAPAQPQPPTNGGTESQPAQPPQHTPPSQPPQHTTPTNNSPPRTTITPRESEQLKLFDVPDYELAERADRNAYRQLVKKLHKEMSGGDSTEYVETKIALPRSLQGLKTGQVMTKLFTINPTLNSEEWETVMADVVGPNLVVGTVNQKGHAMIDALQEIKVEPGRTVKVPPASKPNNFYYVELLLPYERELHIELLEAFLITFPTARHVSMPGKKPWGTTRRIRLYFNTTLAPREVFTSTHDNIPIREVVLDCGTAAQVIHKWQRLNQFRPPHLMNRWNTADPARSYAAAAATNNTPTSAPAASQPNPQSAPSPRSYAAAAANNHNNHRATNNQMTNPPNIRTAPTTQPQTARTTATPNVITNPHVRTNNNTNHHVSPRAPDQDEEDWTSPSQFTPLRNAPDQINKDAATTNTDEMITDTPNTTDQTPPNRSLTTLQTITPTDQTSAMEHDPIGHETTETNRASNAITSQQQMESPQSGPHSSPPPSTIINASTSHKDEDS